MGPLNCHHLAPHSLSPRSASRHIWWPPTHCWVHYLADAKCPHHIHPLLAHSLAHPSHTLAISASMTNLNITVQYHNITIFIGHSSIWEIFMDTLSSGLFFCLVPFNVASAHFHSHEVTMDPILLLQPVLSVSQFTWPH